jgi:hypothetical protein
MIEADIQDLRQNATDPIFYLGATENAAVAVSALLSLAGRLRRKQSPEGEQPYYAALKE